MAKRTPQKPKFKPGDRVLCVGHHRGTVLSYDPWTKEFLCEVCNAKWSLQEKDLKLDKEEL